MWWNASAIPHGPAGRCQWLRRRGRPAILQLEPPRHDCGPLPEAIEDVFGRLRLGLEALPWSRFSWER